VAAPLGTRPAFTGHRSPYKPNVPCFTQKVPDLNGAATGPADGSSGPAARSAIARSAARNAQAGSGGLTANQDSVTSQLVSRLNPFRKATP
jgi:hypothetical protein